MDKCLVVPAAGRSRRFPNMKPKWMLTHPTGDLMIQHVLKPFDFSEFKNVYIVLTKHQCVNYDADVILNQIYGDKVNLVILDSFTASCPETIYEFIRKENITGHIVVKDCDCFVDYSTTHACDNYIVGLNINSKKNLNNLPAKSFVVRDREEGIISDIVEKKVISEEICLGVYGCLIDDFLLSYDELITETNIQELYMSHVISNLIINHDCIFQYIEAVDFKDWGTVDDWFSYTKKFKTYILDIDGVFLENVGKYGSKNWENSFRPIDDNITVLKKMSDEGNEIIFMTARDEKYVSRFREYLKDKNISYKTIITSCNHAQRIIVNDYAASNPYPSCESISIKRNGSLGDYLR